MVVWTPTGNQMALQGATGSGEPAVAPFDGRGFTTLALPSSRICMIPGVLLKELAVGVDSNDDSYLPKNISLLVGNSESNLKELKAVIVPR